MHKRNRYSLRGLESPRARKPFQNLHQYRDKELESSRTSSGPHHSQLLHSERESYESQHQSSERESETSRSRSGLYQDLHQSNQKELEPSRSRSGPYQGHNQYNDKRFESSRSRSRSFRDRQYSDKEYEPSRSKRGPYQGYHLHAHRQTESSRSRIYHDQHRFGERDLEPARGGLNQNLYPKNSQNSKDVHHSPHQRHFCENDLSPRACESQPSSKNHMKRQSPEAEKLFGRESSYINEKSFRETAILPSQERGMEVRTSTSKNFYTGTKEEKVRNLATGSPSVHQHPKMASPSPLEVRLFCKFYLI